MIFFFVSLIFLIVVKFKNINKNNNNFNNFYFFRVIIHDIKKNIANINVFDFIFYYLNIFDIIDFNNVIMKYF